VAFAFSQATEETAKCVSVSSTISVSDAKPAKPDTEVGTDELFAAPYDVEARVQIQVESLAIVQQATSVQDVLGNSAREWPGVSERRLRSSNISGSPSRGNVNLPFDVDIDRWDVDVDNRWDDNRSNNRWDGDIDNRWDGDRSDNRWDGDRSANTREVQAAGKEKGSREPSVETSTVAPTVEPTVEPNVKPTVTSNRESYWHRVPNW